ncbi:histidine kinase [Streptomyces sp. MMG1533]|uniref:sensor histidine kinase n=1 Tax=Streptomyces sp. MMG1533 TaxID=1415546 RepID=UPI0006AF2DBA|nr:HAMP domain-containing sensor histidine kinase [Streptomyces sp. MMG1533]KOU56493.1 histidine kinase [Streptomyces sp. MMG1533]
MVLGTTVLATSAVLLCQAAGLTVLRSWLTGQVDERLADFRPPSRFYEDAAKGEDLPERPGHGDVLPSDFRVYFYDGSGRLLSGSLGGGRDDGPRLPRVVAALGLTDGRPATVPDGTGDGDWRVMADAGPDGMRAVVALPLDTVEGATSKLLWFSLTMGAVVAAGVVLFGNVVVRLGLRTLTRVELTARRIADGELELRVPDSDADTEVGHLGRALNTMLDRLRTALHRTEASEQQLRHFLADAGHELRTPLTSLQGFAELLLGDPHMSVHRREEAHQLIARNADRMSRLVDDLFLLAKLGDSPAMRWEPVDLLSLAADSITTSAVHHPGRSIVLDPLTGAAGAREQADLEVVDTLGDAHQLAQVTTNLLTNACVHTPPGTRIQVRVGTLRTGPHSGGTDRPDRTSANRPLPPGIRVCAIEVADDGPGLEAADARRVFDRFYRAGPTGGADAEPGFGLGLAISSAIAEAHGGRLEIETRPGEGCTFRLLLPHGPMAAVARHTPGPTAQAPSLPG